MTTVELAGAIYRHPFMLAHKLDGEDPKLCVTHGSLVFGEKLCPFGGVVCRQPYPIINAEMSRPLLELVLKLLHNRDAEGKPNV